MRSHDHKREVDDRKREVDDREREVDDRERSTRDCFGAVPSCVEQAGVLFAVMRAESAAAMSSAAPDAYVVEILDHGHLDPVDDNVDVFVHFPDGRRYVATFFTVANIQSLMRKDRTTGECAGGLYFWASDMIVVERMDRETIERTVADLMRSGMFGKAFDGPHAGE